MNNSETGNRIIPPFLQSEDLDADSFVLPGILESEDFVGFGITKNKERANFLKLLYKNGEQEIIFYNRIGSPISYDGGAKIKIPLSRVTVQIIGTNVASLLDYLGNQQLIWIKEAEPGDRMATKKGEPLVSSIKYTD